MEASAGEGGRPASRAAVAAVAVALTLASFLVAGLGQGAIPLDNAHEGRVFETARAMIAADDWVVPSFLGEPRFEKPPLAYWLSAIAFEIFGLEPAAGRLTLGPAAALAVLATAFIALRLGGPRLALVTALVLLGSWLFVREFRRATTDPYLTTGCVLGVAGFLAAWTSARPGARAAGIATGWTGLALGLLAKGPVALLWVLLGALLVRPAERVRMPAWSLVVGALGAIAPVIAWMVAVAAASEGGPSVWFSEVTQRFDGKDEDGRLFVYLGAFPHAAAPWTLALAAGFTRRDPAARRTRWWLVAGLVFLNVLSSRKAAYLLPLMPVTAILIGVGLTRFPAGAAWRTVLVRVSIALVLAAGAAVAVGALVVADARSFERSVLAPVLAVVLGAVAGLGLFVCRRRGIAAALPHALAAGVLAMAVFQGALAPATDEPEIDLEIGRYLQAHAAPEDRLYGLAKQHPVASFYARRPIRTVFDLAEIDGGGSGATWLVVRAREAEPAIRAGFAPVGPGDDALLVLRRD